MKRALDVQSLSLEAGRFTEMESSRLEPALFGATDGKAIGTYVEHRFRDYLDERYIYETRKEVPPAVLISLFST